MAHDVARPRGLSAPLNAAPHVVFARARQLRARLADPRSRAAFIYLGATVLARAGSIFLIPLYTRALDLDEYGLLALAQTIVVFLATPLSLGLNSSVVRQFYASASTEESTFRAGSSARWMIASTALVSAMLVAAGVWLPLDAPLGLPGSGRLLVVAAAGTALATLPVVYHRASQQPLRAAAFQLGEFCASLGAGLGLVLGLGRGLRGAVEALAVSGALMGTVAVVFVFARLPGRFDPAVLRSSLRFSVPLVPHGAANQVQQMSDRWVLRWNGLESALGSYALAGQVAIPVSMTIGAWNEAVTPSMGEVYRQGGTDGLIAALPRFLRTYLGMAALPAVAVIAALPVFWMILGDRFTSSLFLVPVLCVIMALECAYYPLSNVLFFADRPSSIVRVSVGSGILNVLLNVALIPVLGVWGAFVSRLLSMGARTVAVGMAVRTLARE